MAEPMGEWEQMPSLEDVTLRALKMVDDDRMELQLRVNKAVSELQLVQRGPLKVTTHSRACWQWHVKCLAIHIRVILTESESDE